MVDNNLRYDHPITAFLKYHDCIIQVNSFVYNCGSAQQIDWNKTLLDINYYYNEHTCPSNWLDKGSQMFDFGHDDNDPHGMFKLFAVIETRDWQQTPVTMQELLDGNSRLVNAIANDPRPCGKITK